MWQTKLIKGVLNAGKRILPQTAPKVFARTIAKGSGRRNIVSGFTGANLDENHFKWLEYLYKRNIRPVIAGFSGAKNKGRYITAMPGRGFVKFFPNYNTGKMSKHVVYDIQTQRTAVNGFQTAGNTLSVVTKGNTVLNPAAQIQNPAAAAERIVIQGFGGNSAEKIYKPMDANSKRTVVKGFMA